VKQRSLRIAVVFLVFVVIDFSFCVLVFWDRPSLLEKTYDCFFLPLILVPQDFQFQSAAVILLVPPLAWTATMATFLELGIAIRKPKSSNGGNEVPLFESIRRILGCRTEEQRSSGQLRLSEKIDKLIRYVNVVIIGWLVCAVLQFAPFLVGALILGFKGPFYQVRERCNSIAELYLWPSTVPGLTDLRDETRYLIVPALFWGAVLWASMLAGVLSVTHFGRRGQRAPSSQ